MATEHLFCRLAHRRSTVADYSAVITGILLALSLPPGFPLWMAVVGGFVSIALGKMIFGGLGQNPFNPALVGRAFLQAAFPVAITTWSPVFSPSVWSPDRFMSIPMATLSLPFMRPDSVAAFIQGITVDGFTGATPLARMKFEGQPTPIVDLIMGMTSGSTGETSAVLILICGAYLIFKGLMNWRIPASLLGTTFILSWALHLVDSKYPEPLFVLFSGGLMLGAVFMASDMVGSPVTRRGVWIYGALIGFLIVLIRVAGGLPEGVMYAILLGNACTPIINMLTQPKPFGWHRPARQPKGEKS
ncbi:MAG: electron transport complex subunit D [Candidatus Hydrogenedentota bacterium]